MYLRCTNLKICKELKALSTREVEDAEIIMSSKLHIALLERLPSYSTSLDTVKKQSTFPLEIKITPCSYLAAVDLNMRMGIDASSYYPLKYAHAAYPERLTLRRL